MQITKSYQGHFTPVSGLKQLLLPLDVEIMVDPDDPVRWVDAFVNQWMEEEKQRTHTSNKGRKPTYSDRTLLKVCLMAAVLAGKSTRTTEDYCRHDIRFRWLLEGAPPPDHTTIWRFERRFQKHLPDLLLSFNRYLWNLGLITSDYVLIDGTKIESAANRYTFVWKKSVLYYLEQLLGRLPDLFARAHDVLASDEVVLETEHPEGVLVDLLTVIQAEMVRLQVVRVQGKGRRKHELQRLEEELLSSLERIRRYDEHLSLCGPDRNSYSKTDPDATFMRMKDDHMRNGQLKPAYNLNIAVNSEFIVGVDLSQDRTDYHRALPLLDELELVFGRPVAEVVLDAGYDSEEMFDYCYKKGITPYIKPQYYELQKKKSYFKNPKNWRSMIYDETSDTFECLGGRTLRFVDIKTEKTHQGLESEKRIYECEDCRDCPLKPRCTTSQGNRQIHWNQRLDQRRQASEALIQTERGILLRLNRSIQAEGAFGSLKSNRGWKRLRHYGMENARAEVIWEVMGHNLLKLSRKMTREDPFQHLIACEIAA